MHFEYKLNCYIINIKIVLLILTTGQKQEFSYIPKLNSTQLSSNHRAEKSGTAFDIFCIFLLPYQLSSSQYNEIAKWYCKIQAWKIESYRLQYQLCQDARTKTAQKLFNFQLATRHSGLHISRKLYWRGPAGKLHTASQVCKQLIPPFLSSKYISSKLHTSATREE